MSPHPLPLDRIGVQAAPRRSKGGRRGFMGETPTPTAALGDRIAKTLARRPMSAPTLAALLDAKELAVSIQLAAMAEAGQVEAGPALGVGVRFRVWKSVA